MGWEAIPHDRRVELLQLKRDQKLTSAHAAAYHMPLETLERRLREFRREYQDADIHKQALALTTRIRQAAPKAPTYKDYIVLESDNAIVCSDWEFPDTDVDMLVALLLVAQKNNIKTLVIAGDLDSGDLEAFNHWEQTLATSSEMTFPEHFHLLHKILKAYAQWFTRIIIFTGNHDERIPKLTKGQLSLGFFFTYANPEIEFSCYRYMYLRTSRGSYLISHPRNYSGISLGLGQKLSNVNPGPYGNGERVGVIVAHTHHGSTGFTQDGSREVIGLGCMRDPDKTKYKQLSDGTNNAWNQGFLMIKRAYMYPLWRNHTDWHTVLGSLIRYAPMLLKPKYEQLNA
jgi:hypothetical protein